MYLVTAIVTKECLNDIVQELSDSKIEGITVSDVIGKGGFGFNEGGTDLDPKIRIDIVVSNDIYKEKAKEAIRSSAQALDHGAGKMWVTPVLEVERIRTGETDAAALTQSSTISKKILHDNFYTTIDTPAS